jgi:hypothetical protein
MASNSFVKGMIAMWLKEGGAENALQHIRHSRLSQLSSTTSAAAATTPWIVIDDAELFAGARLCLQQVRFIFDIFQVLHSVP